MCVMAHRSGCAEVSQMTRWRARTERASFGAAMDGVNLPNAAAGSRWHRRADGLTRGLLTRSHVHATGGMALVAAMETVDRVVRSFTEDFGRGVAVGACVCWRARASPALTLARRCLCCLRNQSERR